MAWKKELRVDGPVTVGDVAVFAVTEMAVGEWGGRRGGSFYGFKLPVGVVVVTPGGRSVFGMDGEPIAPERFEQDYPGLGGINGIGRR